MFVPKDYDISQVAEILDFGDACYESHPCQHQVKVRLRNGATKTFMLGSPHIVSLIESGKPYPYRGLKHFVYQCNPAVREEYTKKRDARWTAYVTSDVSLINRWSNAAYSEFTHKDPQITFLRTISRRATEAITKYVTTKTNTKIEIPDRFPHLSEIIPLADYDYLSLESNIPIKRWYKELNDSCKVDPMIKCEKFMIKSDVTIPICIKYYAPSQAELEGIKRQVIDGEYATLVRTPQRIYHQTPRDRLQLLLPKDNIVYRVEFKWSNGGGSGSHFSLTLDDDTLVSIPTKVLFDRTAGTYKYDYSLGSDNSYPIGIDTNKYKQPQLELSKIDTADQTAILSVYIYTASVFTD